MLSNIVDIDVDAMKISLTEQHGALILFDFKAAFPSVSHHYMLIVLRHIGIPSFVLHLIEAMYDQGKCVISCCGRRFPGFGMESGIKQGCPLSPLLFVAVVDMLLRRITTEIPGSSPKAFADDIGLTICNFWAHVNSLQALFRDFAQISGLCLNIPKTVVIPLCPRISIS